MTLQHETEEILWEPQPGPQTHLLTCPESVNEIFYGGARGGGKTDGALGEWIDHQDLYGADAIGVFFRRVFKNLEEVLRRSFQLFPALGAEWVGGEKSQWTFPNGAVLKLRHLKTIKDAQAYQGHSYTRIYFEELTEWPDAESIDALRATLRSAKGVPVRLVATGNPGGPGHEWVKARYIDPSPTGYDLIHDRKTGFTRVFIPAKLEDNPKLIDEDPGYAQRLHAVGSPELVKAWRRGDWNIVAGAMFAGVWKPEIHIIPPFRIPEGWFQDRSFDWGSAKPFSVGWWAESNGEEVTINGGARRSWPKGTLFRVAEWYGCRSRRPEDVNVGLSLTSAEIARGIVQAEERMARSVGLSKVRPGPADTQIFDAGHDGRSIADEMERCGVRWERAEKGPGSRRTGWQLLFQRLKASVEQPMEDPGLFIFETCKDFIRTIPRLPRDTRDPDDVDTDSEDHVGDETRYRLQHSRSVVGSFSRMW